MGAGNSTDEATHRDLESQEATRVDATGSGRVHSRNAPSVFSKGFSERSMESLVGESSKVTEPFSR